MEDNNLTSLRVLIKLLAEEVWPSRTVHCVSQRWGRHWGNGDASCGSTAYPITGGPNDTKNSQP